MANSSLATNSRKRDYEYQDSSDIQESFISKISHDNVFMVGDIKQSIYRFRNANPDIFAEKLSKYGVEEGGHAIYLQKNFRSRLEVIDFVNDLFGKIMSPEVGEVDYTDGQALEFGNKALYGETPNDRFKATILSYELEEDLEKAELEARAIANDIIDKVQNGLEVTVKNQVRSKSEKIQARRWSISSLTHTKNSISFITKSPMTLR